MTSNSFYIKIILQILVILLTCFAISWAITKNYLAVTYFTLSLLLVLEAAYLIYFLTKSNRSLTNFLNSIIYNELTFRFDEKSGHTSAKELNKAYNTIIEKIEESIAEKEKTYQYLNHVIEQMNIGIITYNENGEVELSNSFIKQLLKLPHIKNINDLNQRSQLGQIISKILPLKSIITTIPIENELKKLMIKSSKVKSGDTTFTIVSIHDVKNELDEEEFKSWNKLIRVLTHEIMNSITPIISLTKSLIRINKNDHNEGKKNTLEGLAAIQNRSSGLSEFVDSYKKLTKIPNPEFKELCIKTLLNEVKSLIQADIDSKAIDLQIDLSEDSLTIQGDEKLLSQVIINIVQNAIDASAEIENPKIKISSYLKNKQVFLEISNNGNAISDEILDKIFIPFFTTKDAGSGIGLSLSKQIILLHKATISVSSDNEKGTVFTIKF